MFLGLRSSLTAGNRLAFASTSPAVSSLLPSSITRISCGRSSGASARVTLSRVARMFSRSLYAGITTESERSNAMPWLARAEAVDAHLRVLVNEREGFGIGLRPLVLYREPCAVMPDVVDLVSRQRGDV